MSSEKAEKVVNPPSTPVVRNSRRCWLEPRPEGEIAGEQSHQERAGDVDDQGSEREAEAELAGSGEVDAVAQRAADAGAEKDDEVQHKPPTAASLRT